MSQLYANKGMYLEEVVNRTIEYYFKNSICFIEKRQIPLKIVKKQQDNIAICRILSKSYIDYAGEFKSKHIEFECKQTGEEVFDITKIKQHQLNFMNKIKKFNCFVFVLIYFEKFDSILLVPFENLLIAKQLNKKNKIPYEKLLKHGYELSIVYPGILNLVELFKKLSVFF